MALGNAGQAARPQAFTQGQRKGDLPSATEPNARHGCYHIDGTEFRIGEGSHFDVPCLSYASVWCPDGRDPSGQLRR